MPQITQFSEIWASQLFWLAVFFGIAFLLVSRMLPKVTSTIETRDQRVADDLAAAEFARVEVRHAEERWRVQESAAHTTAQQRLAAAREEAADTSDRRLAEAEAAVVARLAAAEADIAAACKAAQGEIETAAIEAAQAIVARFSGVSVTGGEAQQVVKAVLHA